MKTQMKTLLGLAAGFGLYHLIKRSKANVSGLGDEGAYGYLLELGQKADRATKLYRNREEQIRGLNEKLAKEGDEYHRSEAGRQMIILARINELTRQRDQAVMEASLILRDVINPLRSKMITEEARLKSAVIAPRIALKWSGHIPMSGFGDNGDDYPYKMVPLPREWVKKYGPKRDPKTGHVYVPSTIRPFGGSYLPGLAVRGPVTSQAPSKKTQAMVGALERHYERLKALGVNKYAPLSMKAAAERIQKVKEWSITPMEAVTGSAMERPASEAEIEKVREDLVKREYVLWKPEMERMEMRLRSLSISTPQRREPPSWVGPVKVAIRAAQTNPVTGPVLSIIRAGAPYLPTVER